MRKYLNIIFITILCFLSINMVYADKCDELIMYANSGFYKATDVVLSYGTSHIYYSKYTLNDSNSSTAPAYSAYCRNAGVTASKDYNGIKFKCDHQIFDTASTDEEQKTYEAGIVGILKNGYGTKNPSYLTYLQNNGLTENEGYVATNVALRVYEMIANPMFKDYDKNLNNAHKHYAKLWSEKYKSRLTATFKNPDLDFSEALTVHGWIDSTTKDITKAVEGEAERLFEIALKASEDYKINGAASLKGLDRKPETTSKPVQTDRNGIKTYKKVVTYTIEAEKFMDPNAYIKADFSCNDCIANNVTYTVSAEVNGRTINNITSQTNLKTYLNNGTGTIKIMITFSASSSNYSCQGLNYKLNVLYYDQTVSIEAYDVYSETCTSSKQCQHFYMLYTKDEPQEYPIEDTIELCTLSCKEAEEECANGNRQACEIFRDKYNEDCAECTTYIDNAECSYSDTDIAILEGYDIDTSNCGTITEDNLNVLQCIIKGEDEEGNSYQAKNDVNGKYVSNQYCSVYCKEDYHFVVPGIKETNSGRYFALKTSISGAKTCYTSEIDEQNTFDSNLEEARKAVIDAFNEWNKWYQALNGNYTDYSRTHSDWNYRCYTGHYEDNDCPDDKESGTCGQHYVCDGNCDCYVSYDGWYRKWTYTHYNYNSTQTTKTAYEWDDGGSAYCGCFYGSGNDGTIEHIKSVISQKLGSVTSTVKYTDQDPTKGESYIGASGTGAAYDLYKAIAKYFNILNQYNSCSGYSNKTVSGVLNTNPYQYGWKMDYDYDPDVYFWYEEKYMNSVLSNMLETLGSPQVDDDYEQTSCYGDVKNNYECLGTSTTGKNTTYTTERQFMCIPTGSTFTCDYYNIAVSTAKYVKQEMESFSSHITPTQFYSIYPSGAQVVTEEGKEDVISNSSELTNALPVGLGTSTGVFNYTLQVTNLGEYYNNGKLGRIWGSSESTLNKELEDAEDGNSCTITVDSPNSNYNGGLQYDVNIDGERIDNGVYNCSYKVNCKSNECPVECDDKGCRWDGCPTNNCPVECENCIYSNSNPNISYKPITPGNVNPNKTDQNDPSGINWKWDDTITTALELKAYVTTKEIEESQEYIYDISYEDQVIGGGTEAEDNNNFAMTVTLDSQMIAKIKNYNEREQSKGGYANNTLNCYDHKGIDGKTYKNIYCYSSFIDELLYDNSTADNIQIVGNRVSVDRNAYNSFEDYQVANSRLRKSDTQSSGYWTTWSEASGNKWITSTSIGFNYNKNYTDNVINDTKGIGVGPSWK